MTLRDAAVAALCLVMAAIAARAIFVVPPPQEGEIVAGTVHSDPSAASDATGADRARFSDLTVQTCSDLDDPVTLRIFDPEQQAFSPAPEDAACLGLSPERCTFLDLPAGLYQVRQGPHVHAVMLGTQAGWANGMVEMDCTSQCGGELVVSSTCADAGAFELSTVLPVELLPPLAAGTWQAGVPVEIGGLPCQPEGVLRVTGPGCAPFVTPAPLGAPRQRWTASVSAATKITLTLTDGERPLPGLMVRLERYESPPPTDAEGRVQLVIGLGDEPAQMLGRITGPDVAPRDLRPADVQGDGALVMLPTVTTLVRCQHGDAPCGLDTRIWIDARRALGIPTRHCRRLEAGIWSCPVGAGDKIRARWGSQRAVVPAVPGEEIAVELASG